MKSMPTPDTSPRRASAVPDDPVLADLIAELTNRLEAGEPVDLEDYIGRYPEQAEPLRQLWPALRMMADLGESAVGGSSRSDRPRTGVDVGPGVLGDFRLLREVGRGGMGVVYEAEQLSLGRRVALKILPMAAALDPRQLQRFRVEAQAAACLHHTHIVPVHAVGAEHGVPFYAMQFIKGRSLAQLIAELRRLEGLNAADADAAAPDLAAITTTTLAGRLLSAGAEGRPAEAGSDSPTAALTAPVPPSPLVGAGPTPRSGGEGPQGRMRGLPAGQKPRAESPSSTSTRDRAYIRNAARLGLEAAEALDHAHTRGILHRDIKPGNLLIDAEGRLWVTDFGLAQIQGNPGLTLSGDVLGTLRYMSPEQALAKRVVIDGRTDVYSLGVTLYELLTLQPAFDGKDRAEILRRIGSDEPTPLRKLNPSVPRDLETMVARAMDKEPSARYATARDLADDLRNYLEDRPIRARRPNLAERARRWGRRHRTLAWSAATTVLVAALMLAGGIGYVVRDRAARLAQTGQRVAEALAGARTAIEAGNLTLASQRVAEAQGRLGADGALVPSLAAEVDVTRREIDARQADEGRLHRFLKGASDAQDKMGYGGKNLGGDRDAERTLAIFGVLSEKDWLSPLDRSYLTADQKRQVRETAYVTLVSLADFGVRWAGLREDPKSIKRSLELLARAEAFHPPTRAFYFVRAECRRRNGDASGADADDKLFRSAAARSAWDHYLPGHTAGWRGDLDEAIRSYQAALALQPNHYNSLFFLAMRLSDDKINRRAEAAAYFTGCIALRPEHIFAYSGRAEVYRKLGRLDAAEADYTAAIAAAANDLERADAYELRRQFFLSLGRTDEARRDGTQRIELLKRVREEHKAMPDSHGSETLRALIGPVGDYLVEGRLEDAIPLLERWLELERAIGADRSSTLLYMEILGMAYSRSGRSQEGISLLETTLRLRESEQGPDESDTLNTVRNLADALERLRPAEAEPLYRRALQGLRKFEASDSGRLSSAKAGYGYHLLKRGRWAEAETLLRESSAILEKTPPTPDEWSRFSVLSMLGGALAGQRRFGEAEPLLLRGYEGMKQREAKIPTGQKNVLAEAADRIARLYEETGRAEQARAWRQPHPPDPAEAAVPGRKSPSPKAGGEPAKGTVATPR
jgi:serine/threonine protein kinase